MNRTGGHPGDDHHGKRERSDAVHRFSPHPAICWVRLARLSAGQCLITRSFFDTGASGRIMPAVQAASRAALTVKVKGIGGFRIQVQIIKKLVWCSLAVQYGPSVCCAAWALARQLI